MVEVHKVSGAAYDGNAYLVMAERPVLIDAGMFSEPTIRNIRRFMDPEELEMIILTHCHHDHSAAAPAIKERTGAKILLSKEEIGLVGDDLATVAYLFGDTAPEFEVDMPMEDGMVLDLGDMRLEVIHTPGHSPGSVCLYERRDGILFSGDTVFPDGNIGRTDLFGGSTEDLVRSIERLLELDVTCMYPGHMGITCNNVRAQIRESLRFARRFL
ncbi:MAG: MBL fold metallo-hydrolase [Methanothrix sp.]|jgi:glyoxylase-like metal-dependent hydrolase (beta-lactamase superfamily II)|uniref:MBL fold metallo-hydrolase n=1 Tax=Methanothrix sp. TaxID=90426 RepID=UPI00247E1DB7|nr:MBL fold metallo-hydrolase [Methanothrix sp.]MDH7596165.1 MBL fold metallo-hydrolase [Methanothrix sp.]HOK57782.1 MBL fold metallo-hydrolase [Methanothrix sp.]HOL43224.1 MBL fold metallo-hydrolase [Methanothrix sp.]HPO88324.1 MBL fold metallo-hydrolase [Methanothrix sp.]